eukprot:scaffold977_cov103-Isochrysis_galbana.AAC.4
MPISIVGGSEAKRALGSKRGKGIWRGARGVGAEKRRKARQLDRSLGAWSTPAPPHAAGKFLACAAHHGGRTLSAGAGPRTSAIPEHAAPGVLVSGARFRALCTPAPSVLRRRRPATGGRWPAAAVTRAPVAASRAPHSADPSPVDPVRGLGRWAARCRQAALLQRGPALARRRPACGAWRPRRSAGVRWTGCWATPA